MTDASGAETGGGLRVLRIFSRLNIGGPAVHVILLSAGLRPLGYETRLVVGTESPREGNMLPLAAGPCFEKFPPPPPRSGLAADASLPGKNNDVVIRIALREPAITICRSLMA